MQIISNIALITINETLVVQLISFLIFMYIINRIMVRPLRNTIGQRDRYIKDLRGDIDNADLELKHVANLINESKVAIKKEAQEMRDKLEDLGKQQASEQIKAVKEEIAKLKETTENQIRDQVEDARNQIKNEFEFLSVTIMEKILNRRLAS